MLTTAVKPDAKSNRASMDFVKKNDIGYPFFDYSAGPVMQ
jgi:hypothetical protein